MKLLALVESPDHVCCRYRIRPFASFLSDAGWSLSYQGFDRGVLLRPFQLRRAKQFDAVILQRKLLPGWQLSALRRYSRHLVFDFDDAVMFRDSYDERGLESRWRSRRFARTVRAADTVVAGNDFLADCALRDGARVERVHVIPTCVEPRNYPIARQETGGDHLDLVWIGSASTLRGLEQSRPIWERLGEGTASTEAARHLRPISGCVSRFRSIPVAVGRADRSTRDRGRTDRRELDSRRPLEPRQVRTEGPAVSGGRPARSSPTRSAAIVR